MRGNDVIRRMLPLVGALIAALAGCRTVHRSAEEARSSIMSADGAVAVARADAMADSSVNRTLGLVEQARLRQLAGDREGSSSVFKPELERLFADQNEGALIKGGMVGGQLLAGTFADDTAIPYELPPFELLFALQYQFLNELAAGEFDTAGVYLRRATWYQERLREQNAAADAEAAAEKSENAKAEQKATDVLDAKLSPIADTVRASYENALVWYLRGLWLECDDQLSNAELSYREAATLAPSTAAFPRNGADDVVVVYEEGLVDLRYPIKIPLPLTTVVSCDFPVYRGDPYRPCDLSATLGGVTTNLVKVVDVQALGYRDLKDRIPGMVTRNVTRTAVKIAAQQVANNISTGNATVDLLLQLGVLVYNAASTVVCEADTRCWTTLPECVQLARLKRTPGATSVRIARAGGQAMDVALPSCSGPVLVWVTDVGSSAQVSVLPFSQQVPAPPPVRVTSLVGAGDGRFR